VSKVLTLTQWIAAPQRGALLSSISCSVHDQNVSLALAVHSVAVWNETTLEDRGKVTIDTGAPSAIRSSMSSNSRIWKRAASRIAFRHWGTTSLTATARLAWWSGCGGKPERLPRCSRKLWI